MGQSSSRRAYSEEQTRQCAHADTVTTFIAGLARTVCETCGNVGIRHLGQPLPSSESAAPEVEETSGDLPGSSAGRVEEPVGHVAAAQPRNTSCKRCEADALFITPWGLACGDHAWEAASKQDALSGDFWIPLLIDRTNLPR